MKNFVFLLREKKLCRVVAAVAHEAARVVDHEVARDHTRGAEAAVIQEVAPDREVF